MKTTLKTKTTSKKNPPPLKRILPECFLMTSHLNSHGTTDIKPDNVIRHCPCSHRQKKRHFHAKTTSAKLYIYIGVGPRDLFIDIAHMALDQFRFAVFFPCMLPSPLCSIFYFEDRQGSFGRMPELPSRSRHFYWLSSHLTCAVTQDDTTPTGQISDTQTRPIYPGHQTIQREMKYIRNYCSISLFSLFFLALIDYMYKDQARGIFFTQHRDSSSKTIIQHSSSSLCVISTFT